MGSLLIEEHTSKIRGTRSCAHQGLRAAFLESVSQEALGKYFKIQKVNSEIKMKLHLYDDKPPLGTYCIADVVCFDKRIVEIGAALFLHKDQEAQTIDHPLGVLIRSGSSSLSILNNGKINPYLR